jgi:hydroxymethylpyrimidine/phosphomethylpyrimidine kinase
MRAPPAALTVAGSDSGGGAGVQADLRTFAAHGVWGLSAVTAVTAQNPRRVEAVEVLPPEIVRAQIMAVAAHFTVGALKTGMLGGPEVVEAVAKAVRDLHLHPLVVDPVAVATSGASLLGPEGLEVLRAELLPLADLVTPNLSEAAALAGTAAGAGPITDRAGMEAAAEALLALGARAVLVTGGPLEEEGAPDLLVTDEAGPVWLEGERLSGRTTHGTGCVLSAAITARLARGETREDAVRGAKTYLTRAIAAGLDRV